MAWLVEKVGAETIRRARVVLPTEEFFPDPYDGSPSAVRALLDRVCGYIEVDPSRVELQFYSEKKPSSSGVSVTDPDGGTAGLYSEAQGKAAIWLEASHLEDPLSVVATFAHELCHFHLLGRRLLDPPTEDHEPLADLATVCFGLGAISANAVIRETSWHAAGWEGWRAGRHGYLTAAMLGYALAWFAWYRGESGPAWANRLRPDALDAFRKGLRYLQKRGAAEPIEAGGCPSYPPGAFRPPQREPEPEKQYDEHGWEELHLGETHHEGCVARGMLLADEGDFEAAVREYSEAITADPNDAEVYQLRASAWWRLGEHAKAVADADQAIRLAPHDLEGYRVRGLGRFGRREFDAALADFNRVLDDEPDDAAMYYWCGRALAAQGHYQRALRQYHQAIRHAPVRAEFYEARAEAYERLGHAEKARSDRDEARRRAERETRQGS